MLRIPAPSGLENPCVVETSVRGRCLDGSDIYQEISTSHAEVANSKF